MRVWATLRAMSQGDKGPEFKNPAIARPSCWRGGEDVKNICGHLGVYR